MELVLFMWEETLSYLNIPKDGPIVQHGTPKHPASRLQSHRVLLVIRQTGLVPHSAHEHTIGPAPQCPDARAVRYGTVR